jgi:DnaD/phage-associated family protein
MGFFKQVVNLDLGEIAIENIFINDFMPMANGTFVKVYLIGYKYATDATEVSNNTIAKHLNVSIEDVINAWNFWEEKGIIKIHENDLENNPSDFDIEFFSLRQRVSNEQRYTRNQDVLLAMEDNEGIRKMFRELNEIVHRELQPPEKLKVLNIIERYNMDPKVITQAFKYSVEKKSNKNINYISAILRNWYDDGIVTFRDLEEHFNKNTERYQFYKKVYLTLGYSNNLVSAGDKEVIDKWLDTYHLDEALIVDILKEASKKTSNININYVDSFVTSAVLKNLTSKTKRKVKRERKTRMLFIISKQVIKNIPMMNY